MITNLEVFNRANQRIDTIVEGNDQSRTTLVLVHGFGTNKDERGLFIDISKAFVSDYRIVRFDFSGYGLSEGLQEEMSLSKMADDLNAVLSVVRQTFGGKLFIIAHSLGTIVTSLLAPDAVEKTIFTGIPHDDSEQSVLALRKRIEERGGSVDLQGISTYPRKDGTVQKLGPQFWHEYGTVDRIGLMTAYAKKSHVVIIKASHDDVIDASASTKWKSIAGVELLEIDGDHSFSGSESRTHLLQLLRQLIAMD